jgi:hypothetical protein
MNAADLSKPKYTGIMQTLWLVTKEEGPLALWKGNGANVLRVIPVYGERPRRTATACAAHCCRGARTPPPARLELQPPCH